MTARCRRAACAAFAAAALGPLILSLPGCVTPSPQAAAPPRACAVAATEASPAESLSVATTTPIASSHAPAPVTDGERFVFAQLYETLINVDCEGRAYPGLARSWTIDATRTRVTLELRDGARFSNGDAVSTRDVVDAWRSVRSADSSLARRLADGTTIVDDRTITVSLPDTEWLVLAEPAVAVVRRTIGARWPAGTGSYRALEPASDVAPGRLTLAPVAPHAAPVLSIRSGPDARDAIDSGVDLLVGADPLAVRYAAAKPDLGVVPLPWQHTYVLLVPARDASVVSQLALATPDSAAVFRASLARDAVRADARGAEPRGWWSGSGCDLQRPQGASPGTVGQRARRIVYRADDPVARALAERLVALGPRATATPLTAAELARALRAGDETGYVVDLPRASLAPCHDLRALVSAAPWLADGGGVGDAIVPLVDTREPALANRRRVAATIDFDGVLRLGAATGRP